MSNLSENRSVDFHAKSTSNPCDSCSAYCCKMLLIPYKAPLTFMDLDYIKYMLGFPGIKMVLYPDGNWQIKIEQNCQFLSDQNKCSVHGSDEQPKTCSFYNPYSCFYKDNFSSKESKKLLEMNLTTFNSILKLIEIDDNQNISAIPDWDVMLKLTT